MASIAATIVQDESARRAGTPPPPPTLGYTKTTSSSRSLQKNSSWIRWLAIHYYGALHYYTIDPISRICEEQDDLTETVKLLCLFKSRKHEEIKFVRVASTLSAAASIGSLSWPDISTSLWAAKYFLVISLYLSIFAMVSSAASRQLDYLPNHATAEFSEREVQAMLSLLLKFPEHIVPEPQRTFQNKDGTYYDARPNISRRPRGVLSRYKQYFWQISMMLMSWSWLTYLVGVLLYIITPLTQLKLWTPDTVASLVVLILILLISGNFIITNNRAFALLESAKANGLREDSELVNRSKAHDHDGW